MIGIFVALLSGMLMSVQGVFNTQVAKGTSTWVANSWVQFSALLVCLIAWMFKDRKSFLTLFHMEPKYMLLGGVIGAFITLTVIKSMADLGPAKSAMLIVVAQITLSYVIEVFGLFGVQQAAFEWKRLLGVVICAAGILLFHW